MLTASIKPLISVAIVTYNHEKYIAKALDSVLAQRGLFAIEIIVGECFLESNKSNWELLLALPVSEIDENFQSSLRGFKELE